MDVSLEVLAPVVGGSSGPEWLANTDEGISSEEEDVVEFEPDPAFDQEQDTSNHSSSNKGYLFTTYIGDTSSNSQQTLGESMSTLAYLPDGFKLADADASSRTETVWMDDSSLSYYLEDSIMNDDDDGLDYQDFEALDSDNHFEQVCAAMKEDSQRLRDQQQLSQQQRRRSSVQDFVDARLSTFGKNLATISEEVEERGSVFGKIMEEQGSMLGKFVDDRWNVFSKNILTVNEELTRNLSVWGRMLQAAGDPKSTNSRRRTA